MGKVYPGIHGMRKYISPSLHNSSSILERSRKLEFRNDRLFLGMTRNSDLHYENIFMEDRCYFFFSLQINKRKMVQDPNGDDELLQMFGIQFLERREILFRNVFMEDDRYFFFFFLKTNKVDPNGEKMDYCTRL